MKRLIALSSALTIVFVICAFSHMAVLKSATQERTYKLHQEEKLKNDLLKNIIRIDRINNLQSSNFPDDLQIEFTNVSKKPIYHISIFVILDGNGIKDAPGFQLLFGNRKLVKIMNLPEPNDPVVRPGETGILKVDQTGTGLHQWIVDHYGTEQTSKLCSHSEWVFQTVNFGDGTGYSIAEPYPVQRQGRVNNQSKIFKTSFLGKPVITQECSNWDVFIREDPCNGFCYINNSEYVPGAPNVKICYKNITCGEYGVCQTDFKYACYQPCPPQS